MGLVEEMEGSLYSIPGAPLCSVLCPGFRMQLFREEPLSVNIGLGGD